MTRWFVCLDELEFQRLHFRSELSSVSAQSAQHLAVIDKCRCELKVRLAQRKNPALSFFAGDYTAECRKAARTIVAHRKIIRWLDAKYREYAIAITVCHQLIEGWDEENLARQDRAKQRCYGSADDSGDDSSCVLTRDIEISQEAKDIYLRLCPPLV